MSEITVKSAEDSEKEPEIIYLEYQGNMDTNEENIILEVSEKDFSENEDDKRHTNDQHCIRLLHRDSPELGNIEEYKMDDHRYASTPDNIEDNSTVVLCETTYDSEVSADRQDNILDDIPTEILVYTCQPVDQRELNRYPCKGCDAVVGCIFCLKSHYESIHLNLGIIQYKCEQTTYLKNYTEICHKCNLVCESKEEMIEHRKIHFVTCDVCDMSFDSALFLSNHCKTAHEKFEVIISCDLCDQWFKHLYLLSDHYECFHDMILCIVCFKRFSSREELDKHHNSHSIVLRNTGSVLPYACSKCNQAFAEICDLSTHLTREHSKRKSDTGGITTKSKTVRLSKVESICDTGCDKAKAKYLEQVKHKRLKKISKGED
ncbi:zinc finger protein 528-like [Sitophilus oryzae]|uniref:Zinc finger protein 528-like n=1 Tax=Sitophilus oryzae TaxID=7048 RepID=A0A6J2YC63_SITOR|nr:zinc finger protein 528-like [Sitophilus oryzae]